MSMTLWRRLLYKELQNLTLSGDVLDIGGESRSGYHELIHGEHKISVNNLYKPENDDLSFDLEQLFPTGSGSYDAILCINVLEHIFNYQNVLRESHRTLKDGGQMVIAVPFLIAFHPSPNDYWRYTEETLQKICEQANFKDVEIKVIGTGVFGASYSMTHGLWKIGFIQKIFMKLAQFLDFLVSKIKAESFYSKRYYPLGYLVVARK